jgi:hypothetical protein
MRPFIRCRTAATAATVCFASANSLTRAHSVAVGKGSICVRLCRPCASTYGRPEPCSMAWDAMSGHSAACVMQAACDSGLACPKPPAEECMVSEWQEVSSHLRHSLPKHTPCKMQHTSYNIQHSPCTMQRTYSRPQSKHRPLHCPLVIIIRPCLSLAATAAAGCSGLNARHRAAAACAHGSGCCCRRRRHASASAAQTTRGNPK